MMFLRNGLMIGVAIGALSLASCSSMSAFVADTIPEWAGGEPAGTPPRAGAPGYAEYVKSLGDQPAAQAAAPRPGTPKPPPRAREPIDDPIH